MSCNELNIVIRGNKEDMSVMDRAIPGDRSVIKKKLKRFQNTNTLP
jgi:hypothetical protein